MALLQDKLTRFFEVLNTSKLINELTEITALSDSYSLALNTGNNDAKKAKIPLLRGILGDYNASTQTPPINNTNSMEGDSFLVSLGGTVDFGSGNVFMTTGDIIEFRSGKWMVSNGGSNVKFYQDWVNDKPVVGKSDVLYIDLLNSKIYTWNGVDYDDFLKVSLDNYVSYTPQTPTAPEQAQAQENIGIELPAVTFTDTAAELTNDLIF